MWKNCQQKKVENKKILRRDLPYQVLNYFMKLTVIESYWHKNRQTDQCNNNRNTSKTVWKFNMINVAFHCKKEI